MPIQKQAISALLCLVALTLLCGCNSGGGSDSSSSLSGAPGSPTIRTGMVGNASVTVSFASPSSAGSSAISGYTVTCAASGLSSRTGSGVASPVTVSGLTNGTEYSCSVTASNATATSSASQAILITPWGYSSAVAPSGDTAAVKCPYSESTYEPTTGLTSQASWTCSQGLRTLSANGLPDHSVGTFPNANNPNAITAQTVAFSAPLMPSGASAATAYGESVLGYALNGVKFDPATAGYCPTGSSSTSQCSLQGDAASGAWHIEALGQSTFNFGVDNNNAHVQPNGAYHYHGVPEGMLTNAGVSSSSKKMVLIGFAPDGYPIYARYGYTVATDATSAIKVIASSWSLKSMPDTGRPSTSLMPMGTFTEDYQYIAGSGDLDECNGRYGVTPDFPDGIYHYYATDTYPFLPRCWKGVVTN